MILRGLSAVLVMALVLQARVVRRGGNLAVDPCFRRDASHSNMQASLARDECLRSQFLAWLDAEARRNQARAAADPCTIGYRPSPVDTPVSVPRIPGGSEPAAELLVEELVLKRYSALGFNVELDTPTDAFGANFRVDARRLQRVASPVVILVGSGPTSVRIPAKRPPGVLVASINIGIWNVDGPVDFAIITDYEEAALIGKSDLQRAKSLIVPTYMHTEGGAWCLPTWPIVRELLEYDGVVIMGQTHLAQMVWNDFVDAIVGHDSDAPADSPRHSFNWGSANFATVVLSGIGYSRFHSVGIFRGPGYAPFARNVSLPMRGRIKGRLPDTCQARPASSSSSSSSSKGAALLPTLVRDQQRSALEERHLDAWMAMINGTFIRH